jgi:predicted dehydrogenase
MAMGRRNSRRDFLKQSSLASVGFWVAGGLTRADTKKASPLERVNVACIGVGGKGDSDSSQAGVAGNVVAICDIDDTTLGAKAKEFPSAKKFNDYRKMLEEMDKQIDAVTVSTPDHTHAPASLMAMRMKKHVYCQKPLTHTVQEARLMRETAAKAGVATQMGNQGTADSGLRTAVEVIQSGAIGPVHEAHVWTNRPVWPQAPEFTAREPEAPVPAHVHWDEFIGTAPFRPYAVYTRGNKQGQGCYHSFNWRGWWDFGTGALGDMACHTANMAFMSLKLGYPTSIVAESGPLNPETYPAWARITFQFPARGEMPPVKFVWYEGKKSKDPSSKLLPPAELLMGQNPSSSGSLLVGEKGTLYSPNDYGAEYVLLPGDKFVDYKKPAPKLARNSAPDIDQGMKNEWIEAIKGGPPALSNFNYAGMLTETILLGNVAMRAGKLLEWDGPNMKFTNAPEANALLKVEPRKGWTV